MGANVVVDNWWTRFLWRHPNLQLALIPAMVGALLLLICWQIYTPPEFSVTVSRPQGLEPTFDVTLRAKNRNVWEHCFKPGPSSAVVAYAGVPLSRADLPGFCVPGMSVARVRFVAAGAGPGMPESLYERLEAQRGRRERVQLTVRVRLDEDRLLPHHVPGAAMAMLAGDAELRASAMAPRPSLVQPPLPLPGLLLHCLACLPPPRLGPSMSHRSCLLLSPTTSSLPQP
ncbi:unnamed protein product [Miscanthus lutarioriparius]|uniref:Uncharacterized protein n=1 Tax=Miscanthus lutarioriparius TaxID=422564 RepID=A0A811PCW5_9POAL|nr:unnamed protein product [Miscanthus lutarioriparius]